MGENALQVEPSGGKDAETARGRTVVCVCACVLDCKQKKTLKKPANCHGGGWGDCYGHAPFRDDPRCHTVKAVTTHNGDFNPPPYGQQTESPSSERSVGTVHTGRFPGNRKFGRLHYTLTQTNTGFQYAVRAVMIEH